MIYYVRYDIKSQLHGKWYKSFWKFTKFTKIKKKKIHVKMTIHHILKSQSAECYYTEMIVKNSQIIPLPYVKEWGVVKSKQDKQTDLNSEKKWWHKKTWKTSGMFKVPVYGFTFEYMYHPPNQSFSQRARNTCKLQQLLES